MNLNEYVTLGRSGLKVSPLALGTMTFGTEWGFGVEENISRDIFNHYVEAGGNFIDTADVYTNGKSEEMVGKFIVEGKLRDRIVLATKFSFGVQPGNPNAGGNGRKNIYRALEGSLRRLKTDYVDLYWLHAWDTVTPVEEVLSTLDSLVRAGKIRHYGFSDTPAWYVARAHTLAETQGKERLIALQLEYSLVERNIDREHVPAAQEFGLAICPWSPLAGGFLSGKYKREAAGGRGDGRLEKVGAMGNDLFNRYTEHNWRVLDVLLEAAKKINSTPAQVALNWVATQPGITSTIIGATKVAQLDDNFGAIEFAIPTELRNQLDEASAVEPVHPYNFFQHALQQRIHGETTVRPWIPSAVGKGTTAAPKPADAKAIAAKK